MVFRFKSRRTLIKQFFSFISFILFRWHIRIHFYLIFIILFLTSIISYRQPFGLLFNLKYITFEHSSIESIRNDLINQQKQEQKTAYEWLNNILKNPNDYPNLISNQTQQSHFYKYLQLTNNLSSSSYQLLNKPKQISMNTTNHIVISILYSRQYTDHREGKFYLGQILYHLLKNYHSRVLITLCENNNTDEKISDDIEVIRGLLPVFIVNSNSTDTYEREKQAHLQCILANYQSFPNINYLLLLQDDADPVNKDFYDRLLALIDYRIGQQWPLDGKRQQPAFIKIYHPRWLIAYSHPSFYIVFQLIATSLLLTLVFFAVFYLYQTIIQKTSNTHISNTNQLRWQNYSTSPSTNNMFLSLLITNNKNQLYFILYFLVITLVLILLNHSNVSWTWRTLHPSFYAIYSAPSCCLPGVLYFRQTYIQVIDYLTRLKCHSKYAIDTAFDDLPKKIHLQTYLVEPNLVHHIGLYSRLRHMYINPYLLD